VRFALLAAIIAVMTGVFPSAPLAGVSYTDGQHVKLGYATGTPPMWEAKVLPGTEAGRVWFLGSSVSTGDGYGSTSEWPNSNVRRYLHETYLTTHFSPDELATGVLTPYGDSPLYDVVVPDATFTVPATKTKAAVATNPDVTATGVTIPPSSAGGSLIWILDVQEIQAIYNNMPNLPWDDATGYAARLSYAAGGPYRARSVDPGNPSVIWILNADGSFSRDSVAVPALVRPVVSPDASVMLYNGSSSNEFSDRFLNP
jgi:hypothetical protein